MYYSTKSSFDHKIAFEVLIYFALFKCVMRPVNKTYDNYFLLVVTLLAEVCTHYNNGSTR